MKTHGYFVILVFLSSNIAIVDASETVEVEIGIDWYYHRFLSDSYTEVSYDSQTRTIIYIPYPHAPEVPKGFKSRTEYTLRGMAFKPREFWSKPMDEQLIFLKDAVLECNLLPAIDKHHDGLALYAVSYSHSPEGEPYPAELEQKFERAVWETLHNKYDVSFENFTSSLRSMLIPEDKLYSAPLIVYFADKLAPRYEFYYSEFNQNLNKVIKLPSEFELLIGKHSEGEVIYNRFK